MPETLLLGMLQAESGLNPRAERWGDWPDVSFGLAQATVETAAAYDIGDGTEASSWQVREALFDRETAIRVGAQHLSKALARADGDWTQALIVYNSGNVHPEGDWWWTIYRPHVMAYQRALEWAKNTVEV